MASFCLGLPAGVTRVKYGTVCSVGLPLCVAASRAVAVVADLPPLVCLEKSNPRVVAPFI